jgi:hypothetical protein
VIYTGHKIFLGWEVKMAGHVDKRRNCVGNHWGSDNLEEQKGGGRIIRLSTCRKVERT